MAIRFSNNASSTLQVAISAESTNMVIADASTFPALGTGDEMYLTVSDISNTTIEVVRCTDLVGSTLTIVRGYEGTDPMAWQVGSILQLRITAGLLKNLLLEKEESGTAIAMAIALGG